MKKNIEHTTDEKIMLYLLDEINDSQKLDFENWLNKSKKNKEYFEQIKNTWGATKKVSKTNFLDSEKVPDFNTNVAWNKVSNKINFQENRTRQFKAKRKIFYSIGIVATLLILVGIWTVFFNSNKEKEMLSFETLDSVSTNMLADGSIITLNKNAKLEYPKEFSKDKRNVKLEGEAFFDISYDKEKPFIIEMNYAYIQVIGTSFNIKANPEDEQISVLVKTGKVKLFTIDSVSLDTSFVILVAGDKGVVNKTHKKPSKIENTKVKENENDLFWKNKKLVFDKMDLKSVVKILEKNYNISVKIANKEKENLLLTTSFENNSIDEILNIISLTFNLNIEKTEGVYIIN